MATKLTDTELAARTRASNRQRAERQRVRLANAGRVATTVWLTASTKDALTRTAAAKGSTISDAAEQLLSMGLKPTTTTTAKTTAATLSRDALMTRVGEMLDEGLSGSDIARRLNDSGQRTANGATFNSGNLLRDYRAWKDKSCSD